MEIPVNKKKNETKDKIVSQILAKLEESDNVDYVWTDTPALNEELAKEIGKDFKDEGYYARLSYHDNTRFTFFYSLRVSRNPIADINARFAWSQQL